jgi:hypothetical protein
MKRLLIEELERRTMLNGTEIAMASTGLTTNSYEDFYKAQVGTEIGGAAGVGMLAMALAAPRPGQFLVLPGTVPTTPQAAYPEATTGLGQITNTTGANTLGISSFAYPTAGPSRAGGTGNAALGGGIAPPAPAQAAAVDRAIEELSLELPRLAIAKGAQIDRADIEKISERLTEQAQKQSEAVRAAKEQAAREHEAQLVEMEMLVG